MMFTECLALVALAAALIARWRPYRTESGASLILVFGAALFVGAHANPVDAVPPNERGEQGFDDDARGAIVRVVFETSLGDVEIAVYPARAPISASNFLAYVDAGHYDGATIYRAARKSAPGTIGIVQGGLMAAAMSGDADYLDRASAPIQPIVHETTETTSIRNERGTLAFARLEPGTAASEFFFNLSDNPELDTGAVVPGRDGFGYATFGRVLRGIDVLDAIQELPADGEATIEQVQGQILRDPVEIRRAYRVR